MERGASGDGYGACRRDHVVERRRRLQRAALYGAVTLVCVSAAMVLVARGLEEDAGAVGDLQSKLFGSIFLRDSPATIQYAQVGSATIETPRFAADMDTPLMQAAAPYMSPSLVKLGKAWTAARPTTNVQYPMGFFAGAPVWPEKQGAAYVDVPAHPGIAPLPTLVSPAAAFPAYGHVKLPATGQPPFVMEPQLGMAPQAESQIGSLAVPAGLTGSAAEQYAAAYGAAYAATYNALLQGGTTAKKQLALRRLQDKAGTKTTGAPAVSTKVRVMLPQQGWQMPPLARTGTAVVEQALMTPDEVQQQQQQAATDYSGPSINIMSATGGPTVSLNAEERSAFRVNSQGQISDSQVESRGGGDAPASTTSDYPGSQDDSQNPLGAAQGAIAQAAQAVAMPARMSTLSELV